MIKSVKHCVFALLFSMIFSSAVYAEAEVVEAEPALPGLAASSAPAQSYVSAETASATPDLAARFNQLEKEVQDLRGQLEVAQHDLNQLKSQNQSYYDDLSDRLATIEGGAKPATGKPAPLAEKKTTPSFSPKKVESKVKSQPAAALQSEKKLPSTTETKTEVKSDAKVDVKADDMSAAGPLPLVGSQPDAKAYQQAYSKYQAKAYPAAVTAFNELVTSYPQSPYLANSLYWLGELALIEGRVEDAQVSFRKIIDEHPASTKVADSYYKLGVISYDKGEWEQARDHFNHAKQGYPDSSGAKLSTAKLEQMEREGL